MKMITDYTTYVNDERLLGPPLEATFELSNKIEKIEKLYFVSLKL